MSSKDSGFRGLGGFLHPYLTGIEYVGLSFILFFSVNIVVFLAISRWPSLTQSLSVSATRPWGVFTAVFAHDGWGHLVNNLEAFALWGGAFLILMFYASAEEGMYMSKVFLVVPFLSGFLVDGVRFLQWRVEGSSTYALGSSGVVYALIGVFLASAIFSLSSSLENIFRRGFRFWDLTRLFLSVTAVLLIVFQVSSDTKNFLSAAPGVGVFAHGYGFLMGFSISGVLLIYYNLRGGPS